MAKTPFIQLSEPTKYHVRLIEGYYQTLRRLISWPLIGAFFILAWVQVDGTPWLFFSFAERKIFLFGSVVSWHDLPIMAGLMIAGACLLFFMAVAWGRVWCGFACPQSIWTWLFIRIEQITEGKANIRAKNDQLPLTGIRLLRRISKHFLWAAAALITAITFTGYFTPISALVYDLFTLNSSLATAGWIITMTALTYLNAGLVREQICLHACPYSRFQGVMFDSDTRTVSYDFKRGEPRRLRGKKLSNSNPHDSKSYGNNTALKDNMIATDAITENGNSGDCIDCTICVQVCPVGIDIRDGLQAACIDCGACIDACDDVMLKIGKPKGLIRFASEHQLEGQKSRSLFRPKLAGYAGVVTVAAAGVLFGFMNTTDLLVEVRRDRQNLYTKLDQHTFCNQYRVKVENFDSSLGTLTVNVIGLEALQLHGRTEINLSNDNATWRAYRVCSSQAKQSNNRIEFVFNGSGKEIRKTTTFITGAI
ncbi:cytochrome c oxidase accessory protein CcoG [Oceanospirillum maris]|uniref:cytochrome c oxidase accessory protein CcoG n=1 Tax=Oceanospirillum maris TaxID=64977 RepID=UPI0003F82927|nr:cytochrome c oxidase accessory protein CcoG [Oceanospirillum maris]